MVQFTLFISDLEEEKLLKKKIDLKECSNDSTILFILLLLHLTHGSCFHLESVSVQCKQASER